MNLTDEQKEAVRFDDHALIVACPGSGKTRTLIAKLLRCLEEVRGTSRKVACLTYTNAAVWEIEHRLLKYGRCGDEEYCDISTIHSFCLVNILRNFHWRLPEYPNGFSVITPDSEQFREITKNVAEEFELSGDQSDSFEGFIRNPDGTPIVPPGIPAQVALTFWQRLQEKSLIDFPNIIYYTYRLLCDRPSIAYAISCRYAWFLVDEFQDTTQLQVEIFRKIFKANQTKFFLVGDPYQAIYGFAGARVELMETFAKEISAQKNFRLLSNFRSSNLIISHAERLCAREPVMHGVGDVASEQVSPIYVHTTSAFEAITDYFLPTLNQLNISYGNAAILAPWWTKLLPLGKQLRDYGIPIIGPGARPYKKSHIFAMLAEQVSAYISDSTPQIFHHIQKELFFLASHITGKRLFKIFAYEGSVAVCKLIDKGNAIYLNKQGAVNWLTNAAKAFEDILIEEEILPKSSRGVLQESVEHILEDMKNKVDVSNLSVEDLGIFASTDKNLHLLTMHRSKGREFDAVAIIDLHDGRVPDFRAVRDGDMRRIEEDRRLLYVSITRARRFLMYVTDSENARNQPSRFLGRAHLGLTKHN